MYFDISFIIFVAIFGFLILREQIRLKNCREQEEFFQEQKHKKQIHNEAERARRLFKLAEKELKNEYFVTIDELFQDYSSEFESLSDDVLCTKIKLSNMTDTEYVKKIIENRAEKLLLSGKYHRKMGELNQKGEALYMYWRYFLIEWMGGGKEDLVKIGEMNRRINMIDPRICDTEHHPYSF